MLFIMFKICVLLNILVVAIQSRIDALKAEAKGNVILNYCTAQYDNKILNYPALLQAFTLIHGFSTMSLLLDLSGKLDNETIEQICDDANALELLGACIGIE